VPQKARDVKRVLTQKGFEESKGRDHHVYFLKYQGKKTHISTKISHSCSDIHDGLCSAMAREMRLANREFRDFVDCDLTHDGYIEILVSKRELEPADDRPSSKPETTNFRR
jgi:predicted RNA binding protein YcfA (HicA-like mRNA interferase family)